MSEVCIPASGAGIDASASGRWREGRFHGTGRGLYARLNGGFLSRCCGCQGWISATATGFRLTVETGKKETQAVFFPADQDVLDNPAPQKLTATATG